MKKLLLFTLVFILFLSCSKDIKNDETNTEKIKVGVFNGNGASPICVLETLEALKIDTGIDAKAVSAVDIINGKLDSIDVLIFPGGSGSQELNNLGKKGAKKVKEFLNKGKGIVGICAGGYLLSTTPGYPSLRIAAAKNIDRKHYSRGRGLIEVALTDAGLKIFPELKNHKVFLQYYDGPILVPLDSNNIQYTEVAKYVTDIHANPGTPTGVTPGKTFMLTQKVGKGRIFVIGGHAESTPGMRWMIPRMVRYVYSQDIISYPKKWIRPEINTKEIMFTPELQKVEKQYFWQLFNDTPQVRINAMDSLLKLRSRPAVRWTIGMLRDDNPQVRKHAAIILKETEYSAALPDLKTALKTEKNIDVKEYISETIEFLSTY